MYQRTVNKPWGQNSLEKNYSCINLFVQEENGLGHSPVTEKTSIEMSLLVRNTFLLLSFLL
jgi:hypothetical protein